MGEEYATMYQKANLSFATNFFQSLVRTRLSPTQAENVVTWDRAMMIVDNMKGMEFDFSCI